MGAMSRARKVMWLLGGAAGVLAVVGILAWLVVPIIIRQMASAVPPGGREVIASVTGGANVPVVLYGRVVDQDDKPVEGADISMDLSFDSGKMDMSHGFSRRAFELRTDGDGRFVVQEKGRILSLESIRKRGYIFRPPEEEPARSWSYQWDPPTPPVGDFAHPVVFPAWRETEPPEPLIDLHGEQLVNPAKPGESFSSSYYLFPRAASKHPKFLPGKLPDADLWVVWGPESDEGAVQDASHRRWSLALETPDGGLVAQQGPYPYYAPLDGYQSKIVQTLSVRQAQSGIKNHTRFYVRIGHEPRYGFIEVQDSSIVGYVNPSGSRNLQPGGGFLNEPIGGVR
jgi:hypothetical protein